MWHTSEFPCLKQMCQCYKTTFNVGCDCFAVYAQKCLSYSRTAHWHFLSDLKAASIKIEGSVAPSQSTQSPFRSHKSLLITACGCTQPFKQLLRKNTSPAPRLSATSTFSVTKRLSLIKNGKPWLHTDLGLIWDYYESMFNRAFIQWLRAGSGEEARMPETMQQCSRHPCGFKPSQRNSANTTSYRGVKISYICGPAACPTIHPTSLPLLEWACK